MSEEPRKRTIDERLDALVMNAELEKARLDSAEKRIQATEREQRRLRAAVRAALQAWADYEENGE